jgi:hypothetical protein
MIRSILVGSSWTLVKPVPRGEEKTDNTQAHATCIMHVLRQKTDWLESGSDSRHDRRQWPVWHRSTLSVCLSALLTVEPTDAMLPDGWVQKQALNR